MHPHPPLHCHLFFQIPHILGALDLVLVPDISFICLYLLAQVKEVMQHFIKNCNIIMLTSGVETLDPHLIPSQNTDTQLISESGLPSLLVGSKRVPLCCHPLLWNVEVCPINCHETVIEDVIFFLTIEVNLWWHERMATVRGVLGSVFKKSKDKLGLVQIL